MVSFELGKPIEKDVFHLVMSVGQRKKLCGFPWGIESQTLSIPHSELTMSSVDSFSFPSEEWLDWLFAYLLFIQKDGSSFLARVLSQMSDFLS